jgi:hypothetical protein
MSTTKARSTTRKGSLETASDREGASRPRLVTTSRKRRASPESPDAPDAMTVMEHIRVRAYYMSLGRNGFAADPIGDWLRAERELITGGREA